MTNFERFQSLSVSELASKLAEYGGCEYCLYDDYTCEKDCEYGIRRWLESEEKINENI